MFKPISIILKKYLKNTLHNNNKNININFLLSIITDNKSGNSVNTHSVFPAFLDASLFVCDGIDKEV